VCRFQRDEKERLMRHDVFISYAHRDNVPLGGDEKKAWVKRLQQSLAVNLAVRLGRNADVFYDERIKGGDRVKEILKQDLGHSSTLLVVLSPSWVNSDPCKSEYRAYVKEMHKPYSTILVVERIDMPKELWSQIVKQFEEIEKVKRQSFYIMEEDGVTKTLGETGDDPSFYEETIRLAYYIKCKLAESTPLNQPRVFLYANVNGVNRELAKSLRQKESELRDYLEENQVTVTTPERDWFSEALPAADALQLEAELTETIRSCDLFIQLVSKADDGQILVQTQALDIAKLAKKPFEIWSQFFTRDSSEVIFTDSFQKFKEHALKAARNAKNGTAQPHPNDAYMYVDSGDDLTSIHLRTLADKLRAEGYKIVAEESGQDEMSLLDKRLQDPACLVVCTLSTGQNPNMLNARIDTVLDQSLALRKEAPKDKFVLRAGESTANAADAGIQTTETGWTVADRLEPILNTLKHLGLSTCRLKWAGTGQSDT
jgi:hypothetical protein